MNGRGLPVRSKHDQAVFHPIEEGKEFGRVEPNGDREEELICSGGGRNEPENRQPILRETGFPESHAPVGVAREELEDARRRFERQHLADDLFRQKRELVPIDVLAHEGGELESDGF